MLRAHCPAGAAAGARVCIGGSSSTWYTGRAGGTAYVNSWGSARFNTAFVFPEDLSRWAKYICEAVSHELGHTLGLMHDGVVGGPNYYEGEWAVTWWQGESKGCTVLCNAVQCVA